MEICEEVQYLELLKDIINTGYKSEGRGGAKTRSLFGKTMEFSLSNDVIPLFTTKKTFLRGVIEELLWMLRGDTDVSLLQSKGIHIWDAHSSREFLDERGLSHYKEGDIGPCYGFQWRHAGAEYKTCNDNYQGMGVDQIARLISTLKEDPSGRRHLVCAWNPNDLDKMSLTPCHCLFQMYIDDNGLTCMLNQRSADMGLGVPFNVASYSILTKLIAKCLNVKAYKFIHVMGNVHVYEDHIEALLEQVKRVPFHFPTMTIDKDISDLDDILKLSFDDFKLHNYIFHDKIKMKLII